MKCSLNITKHTYTIQRISREREMTGVEISQQQQVCMNSKNFTHLQNVIVLKYYFKKLVNVH